MAFIDTSSNIQVPYASGAITGSAAGAPTGGGAGLSASVKAGPNGANGPGGSGQISHWILAFYAFIAFVLIGTGVLFNGKGGRV